MKTEEHKTIETALHNLLGPNYCGIRPTDFKHRIDGKTAWITDSDGLVICVSEPDQGSRIDGTDWMNRSHRSMRFMAFVVEIVRAALSLLAAVRAGSRLEVYKASKTLSYRIANALEIKPEVFDRCLFNRTRTRTATCTAFRYSLQVWQDEEMESAYVLNYDFHFDDEPGVTYTTKACSDFEPQDVPASMVHDLDAMRFHVAAYFAEWYDAIPNLDALVIPDSWPVHDLDTGEKEPEPEAPKKRAKKTKRVVINL